ncbi:MAG: ComF family protein [Polyangiales bacterium]
MIDHQLRRALRHLANPSRILTLLSPFRCAACNTLLSSDAVFCAPCANTLEGPPTLPPHSSASFAFGGALADVLRMAKFQGRVDLLRPLSRLVIEGLPPADQIDRVVPTPLHPRKLRARGFDQAALLAAAVAHALQRPLDLRLLRRKVATKPLSTLDARARQLEVAGAFVTLSSPMPRGCRVLLVDDVRTTGATLDAARLAIERLGATVHTHVLAATMRG